MRPSIITSRVTYPIDGGSVEFAIEERKRPDEFGAVTFVRLAIYDGTNGKYAKIPIDAWEEIVEWVNDREVRHED